MKKIIIALLACLLMLTGCMTNYTEVTENELNEAIAAGINLLDNPSLETGTAENWGWSDSVYLSDTVAHDGKYSIVAVPNGGVEYFFNVTTADFDKSGALLASCWIKLPSAFDADHVTVSIERQLKSGRNELYKAVPEKTSDWQLLTIEVPAVVDNTTQHIVFKAEINCAQGPIYFDDFTLVSRDSTNINYIRNGSFSNFGDSWSNFNHGYGRDGHGAVLEFDVPGADLLQSTGWWAQKRPAYNPSLDMVFSAYVAPAAGSEGIVRIRAERHPEYGSVYKDYIIKPGSSWQKIELPIKGIDGEVDDAIFHIEALEGYGKLFIDDVSLSIAAFGADNETEEVQTLSFEDIEMPYLTNGALENGGNKIANNWGLAPGWDVVPASYWTKDGEAHSGSGSVFIKQYGDKEQVLLQANGWQDRATTADYNPTKPMLFTAYVKGENITGDGVYLKVERKYDANGTEMVLLSTSERVTGTTDGWVKLECYVEPSDLTFKEYLWDVVVSKGEGSVYVDDLEFNISEESSTAPVEVETAPAPGENVLRNAGLEELNPDGTVLHWDVWPGNPAEGVRNSENISEGAYEGTNSLKVNLEMGNPQAVYQYCVMDTVGKFDFNQEYTFKISLKGEDVMSFDGKGVVIGIKRRGIDGNEYNVYQRIDEFSGDWEDFEVTAEAAPVEIIQYDVIVDIGAGVGSLSMDNCRLVLAEEKPEEPELELAWE